MDLTVSSDVLDYIRGAISEAYPNTMNFAIKYNPQNMFYYVIVNDDVEPIPIDITTGVPLSKTYSEIMGDENSDIKAEIITNDPYVVRSSTEEPNDIFDTDYLIRSTIDICDPDEIMRSGTQGMRWGHRYHQSYEVKPTRSGMVGEEHGAAKAQSDRHYSNKYDKKYYKKDNEYRKDQANIYKRANREGRGLNDREQRKYDRIEDKRDRLNNRYENRPQNIQNEENLTNKKSTGVRKLIDSAKAWKAESDRKAMAKLYKKNEKLRKRLEKQRLKNDNINYKKQIKKAKEYAKIAKENDKKNTLSSKEYADKRKSLMADPPKEVLRKWKGKLDNNDLMYLQKRMGLESDINRKLNPPTDWKKVGNTLFSLGKGVAIGNNVMADFYNTINANEIANGTKKPWPYVTAFNQGKGKNKDWNNNKKYDKNDKNNKKYKFMNSNFTKDEFDQWKGELSNQDLNYIKNRKDLNDEFDEYFKTGKFNDKKKRQR